MTTLKYPLVCFDLDGTLVDDTIYIWKTLHERFNTDKKQRLQAYNDYFNKIISYQDWFDTDLELLRSAGASKKLILETLNSLTVMKGALETLKTLQDSGHKIAIISGSLDIVVSHLFPDFKFDHLLINRITFDQNGLIQGGTHTPYDIEAKADGLKALCKKENISAYQTVFIGDNENDLWIAKEAGLSIAFNCKSDRLAAVCNIEIKERNLMAVLPWITGSGSTG